MDAGTGILPSVRNATGGVFHAERAWAADASGSKASTVSIAGKELNDTNKYYYNGANGGVGTVTKTKEDGKGEPNATFDASTGTLTLNGLNLNLEAGKDIQGIVATGDLTINLIGTNSITQNGTGNAICAWSGLTISGTGSLVTASNTDNANEVNTLIYANGNITIDGGAKITAITARLAQAINANAGNIKIAGEGTSVKAVNENTWNENSDAIRVNSGNGTGNGTVTISDGATLEAETKSSSAKAINGTVVATDYAGKIKAGESKAAATAWTDGSAPALNTYKYVRIGEAAPNYLTFTAQEAKSTISLKWKSADQNSVYISKNDGTTWDSYTAGDTITLTNIGDKVSFKGENVKTWADSNKIPKHFTMSGRIAASGSVTSLTDGVGNNSNVTLQEMCYAYMFEGCTALTTAPELPATNLTDKCYSNMFKGCTALTTAPMLPATNLKNGCYSYMFYNCTSLTTAPELPAKELVNNCYNAMFGECTSLTEAPQLPAMKIPMSAYALMFYKCTSLTAAPKLPATTIDESSYYEMFAGCTSLTMPPSTLPAESLKSWCYNGMFSGCTSLKTVPTISATSLATECFVEMFKDCSKLSISTTSDAQHTQEWKIEAAERQQTAGIRTCSQAARTLILAATQKNRNSRPLITSTRTAQIAAEQHRLVRRSQRQH